MLDEKKRRKKVEEELERIDTVGQESEKKAVKWVKESAQIDANKEREVEATDLSVLNSNKRTIITYKEELAKIIHRRMEKNKWPPEYKFVVNSSPKGIGIFIRNKSKKWFGRGMAITNEPILDLNAAAVLILQADNTIVVSEKMAKESNGKITPL